jgi:diguanylate cyclase (GGDEF)-like protein
VAATLTRNVRASDMVARLRGDEFALLLWNLSEADASAKAQALERAIAETHVRWGDVVLTVGASAGIAMLGPSNHPAEVLHVADQAMYARKVARRLTQ